MRQISFFAEVASILWKKYRLKDLSLSVASAILADFKKLPFNNYPIDTLVDEAWDIATEYQRSLYDSIYLALAKIEQCLFVTADRALYNALQTTPLFKRLLWVEDIS